MSRLSARFSELKKQNKKALITYITAGDPNPGVTVDALHALVKSGVDILEVGVPFSDPMADGPVIQLACERALKHGVRLLDVFDMIKKLRPSQRGELEITDVNNEYIKKRQLAYTKVKGFWSDAGTFESLYRAATLVKEKER